MLHVMLSVIMLSVVILRVIALPGIADSVVHHNNTQNKSLQVVLRTTIKKSCSADLEMLSAAFDMLSVIMLGVVVLRVMALPEIADSVVQNKSYTGGANKDSL